MKKGIHKAEIILITLTAAMLCGCGKTNTDTTERNDASGIAGTEALEQGKLEYASTEPAAVAEAVCQLLDSETLRKTLGSNALVSSKQFGADHMAQCYCDVYDH